MNKLIQPVPGDEELFGPELSDADADADADVDAWIDRNRDVLKVALQEAREQVARGEVSELDMEDIIARGRARFEASKKQA